MQLDNLCKTVIISAHLDQGFSNFLFDATLVTKIDFHSPRSK